MDFDTTYTTKTAEETKNIGRTLAHYIIQQKQNIHSQEDNYNQLICLYGVLGSGKTTFVQGFAEEMGVSERLLSPTFVLLRSYQTQTNMMLHHLDLYRLTNMNSEIIQMLHELFEQKNAVILIEWPEKIIDLPDNRIDVFLKIHEELHTIQVQLHQ